MTVKARTEKNFRRARVRSGRGRRSRSRTVSWRLGLHALTIILFLCGGYWLLNLVVHASPLQVTRILVSGNTRLSSKEVEALARGLQGHSILTADLDACRRRLLGSAWIADAALRRVLPSTIEVHVSEREPMGISRLANKLYLIDRSGTVIDAFGPRYREFDLPIVDGLVRSPKQGTPVIDEDRAGLAARVLDSVAGRPQIARRLSQVDVSNPRDVVVLLDGDDALLHLGDQRFVERLESYVEVAQALRQRVTDIDYVDLRFDDRVYVKPRGEAGTIEAEKASSTAQRF